MSTTTGRAERRERVDLDALGEALDAVVRRVDFQDQGNVGVRIGRRSLVVGEPGAIRRADIDESSARLGHDLRNPEASADLHRLAARDHHVAASPERREHEQHRRGTVVHDERGLGTARSRQEARRVGVTRASASGREVELEVDVARVLVPCNRCASEVRVQEHARCVDHRSQERSSSGFRALPGRARVAGAHRRSRCVDEERVGKIHVSDRTCDCVDRRRSRTHGAEHTDQTSPVSWAPMFLLLLIGVPILEIAVAIWVASEIGWLNTIGLLILLSIIGLWVVKRQGMGIVMTLQETAQRREKPANSLMDRFLILLGGVLLVIPGFVTAAMGLLLFLPPVRAALRGMAAARVEKKVSTGKWAFGTVAGFVQDVDSTEVRRDRQPPPSPPEIENP